MVIEKSGNDEQRSVKHRRGMLVEYGIDGGVDKEGSREKWISFIHYPGIIPCVLLSPFTVYPRHFFAAKPTLFNNFSIEG